MLWILLIALSVYAFVATLLFVKAGQDAGRFLSDYQESLKLISRYRDNLARERERQCESEKRVAELSEKLEASGAERDSLANDLASVRRMKEVAVTEKQAAQRKRDDLRKLLHAALDQTCERRHTQRLEPAASLDLSDVDLSLGAPEKAPA